MEEIGLESSLLDYLISGQKLVEPRLAKERFKNFNIGDKLSVRRDIWRKGDIIDSVPDSAFIEIIGIFNFTSIREMLEFLDYKRVMPSARSLRHALKICRQFFSETDERKYGIVAFEVNLLAVTKT